MDNVIQNYTVLKRKSRSEEALELLKRIALQVKPIMRKRGWKVVHLCEFFPTNPNLLGVNVNRGFKINIRLRPQYDDSTFLEYNDLLGTMLHELTHIVRGPHDDVFYKILDELNDELDELILTGQKGYLAFDGVGRKLGGSFSSTPTCGDLRGRAVAAAEQRRQQQGLMIPYGGVRLGNGGTNKGRLERSLSPAQMAAQAAERRMRDQTWCGGLQEQLNGSNLSPSNSSSANSPEVIVIPDSNGEENEDGDNKNHGQKRSRNGIDILPPAKKPTALKKPIIQSQKKTSTTPESSSSTKTAIQATKRILNHAGWVCNICTFENTDIALACGMCLTQRPTSHLIPFITNWSCPQCTLYNESTATCSACSYPR
ncbi:WLM domain-containing protein [Circinella umbellata]|nr:WLM domain-containing protein [Circinella umbellata]